MAKVGEGKYCGAACRLCRREGEKLFLKGERCFTNKCSIERRESAPGQHGKGRQAYSDYKIQLRAKQKLKRLYLMQEKKFRSYFARAAKSKGVTGTEMLLLLERRLDNVVYRMGFGLSRSHARQLVGHGHVLVNGKRVDIPSYELAVGDVVEIKEKSRGNVEIQSAAASAQGRARPDWISVDVENKRATFNALPTRDKLPPSIQEQLVVELYSR